MATFVQWHFQPAEPGGSHAGHSSAHDSHAHAHAHAKQPSAHASAGGNGASEGHLQMLKSKIKTDLGTKN